MVARLKNFHNDVSSVTVGGWTPTADIKDGKVVGAHVPGAH
jgi:hypothetical protein